MAALSGTDFCSIQEKLDSTKAIRHPNRHST